jgi:hypothetical protein
LYWALEKLFQLFHENQLNLFWHKFCIDLCKVMLGKREALDDFETIFLYFEFGCSKFCINMPQLVFQSNPICPWPSEYFFHILNFKKPAFTTTPFHSGIFYCWQISRTIYSGKSFSINTPDYVWFSHPFEFIYHHCIPRYFFHVPLTTFPRAWH